MIDIKKLNLKETENFILCCQSCKTSNTTKQWYWILFNRNIICLCQNCMESFIDKIKSFTF